MPAGTVASMSDQRWRRGENRERLLAVTLVAVANAGPSAVSGRSIAADAGVHHAQVQQMFGSVHQLVAKALLTERDRYVDEVFGEATSLPDPLAVRDYPLCWRAITQVVLDPGPLDLATLANGGPVELLASRLAADGRDRDPGLDMVIASVWAAAPLGALVFEEPLQRGLAIESAHWPACLDRLAERLRGLTELSTLPFPRGGSATPTEIPPPARSDHGRDRLLAAAEDLLATRLETSVRGRELAAYAGVNYGLVNHYFGSKAAVFDEALLSLHQRFLDDVLTSADGQPAADVPDIFLRHRAFLRAWASRLLGDRPVPNFKLLGMQRLIDDITRARGIAPSDVAGLVGASGDAMAALALQLGWALLQPLPSATPGINGDVVTTHLHSVHRWLIESSD
jgi:AcrR family transcriptional regulator